jgi:hypothetical protein
MVKSNVLRIAVFSVLCVGSIWQLAGLRGNQAGAQEMSVEEGESRAVSQRTLASECPFKHIGGRGMWTGKTKIVNAKIFYEMKCIQGHKWFADKPSQPVTELVDDVAGGRKSVTIFARNAASASAKAANKNPGWSVVSVKKVSPKDPLSMAYRVVMKK